MEAIICLDDRGGMAFNRRRQSQDRALRARLLKRTEGGVLWMNAYSAKQFADCAAPQIRADEAPWDRAGVGEHCFVETADPAQFALKIERLTVYRWNRVYPADLRCGLDLNAWTLLERTDFTGYSHETITEEVYAR